MKVGKIVSVEYDKFKVRLFSTNRTSTVNINGQVYYFGNIGSYLKTINSISATIICEVTAVLDYSMESRSYSAYNLDSSRELYIKPIGTIDEKGEFTMGVGIFPSLYNDVELVTYDDLHKILAQGDEVTSGIHHTIDIGKSKSLINYEISLNINRLFNIHTAILGNSGSGKSNTIAHIFQEVFKKEDNYAQGAKVIIFDSNGEYPKAFDIGLSTKIEKTFYKPNIEGKDSFYLPYYLMNLDEWLAFLMASERTQKPFWENVLQKCYKFYKVYSAKDKDTALRFANYIKWKTYVILSDIMNNADTDSTRMTIAKGAILKMKSLCNKFPNDIDAEILKDLQNFFDVCNRLCTIWYGNNHDSLAAGLPNFICPEDEEKCYVYTVLHNLKSNEHFETMTSSDKKVGSFIQIVEDEAIAVDEENLEYGQYYDYRFLKTAVDLVLLEEEAKGNLRIREFTSTLISRLDVFLNNKECAFMRESPTTFTTPEDYLQKIFGISDRDKRTQLIIIDSSEVGTDTLELMTSVVSRLIFDYRKSKYGENRRKHPVHLVLDEAHRYIRKDATYILKENIFEKIAREGRKYSFFLILSSQRPSELSQTVLSQCGNYIVHRIQNEIDLKYIYSVLPYFSSDYITQIKQAVPGEALLFGNFVPMPLMVKIDRAVPDPDSKNCDIDKEWFKK